MDSPFESSGTHWIGFLSYRLSFGDYVYIFWEIGIVCHQRCGKQFPVQLTQSSRGAVCPVQEVPNRNGCLVNRYHPQLKDFFRKASISPWLMSAIITHIQKPYAAYLKNVFCYTDKYR